MAEDRHAEKSGSALPAARHSRWWYSLALQRRNGDGTASRHRPDRDAQPLHVLVDDLAPVRAADSASSGDVVLAPHEPAAADGAREPDAAVLAMGVAGGGHQAVRHRLIVSPVAVPLERHQRISALINNGRAF